MGFNHYTSSNGKILNQLTSFQVQLQQCGILPSDVRVCISVVKFKSHLKIYIFCWNFGSDLCALPNS